VSEARPSHPVPCAYGDLADGIRALADELDRAGNPDRAALAPAWPVDNGPESPAGASTALGVELLRSIWGVVWLAIVSGVALLVAFHVWMALFPPLRPTT